MSRLNAESERVIASENQLTIKPDVTREDGYQNPMTIHKPAIYFSEKSDAFVA